MNKTFMTLVAVMASTVALAQNAPSGGQQGAQGQGGMGAMMDPAERFKQLDKNNDGKLTSEEFSAGMQMMRPNGGQGGQNGSQGGPQGGPPAGAQGGNGAPPAGANNGQGGMGGMMMNAADRFKSMDKNNDGKVTKEEFTASMQQMRGNGGAPNGAQQGSAAAQNKSAQSKAK